MPPLITPADRIFVAGRPRMSLLESHSPDLIRDERDER